MSSELLITYDPAPPVRGSYGVGLVARVWPVLRRIEILREFQFQTFARHGLSERDREILAKESAEAAGRRAAAGLVDREDASDAVGPHHGGVG